MLIFFMRYKIEQSKDVHKTLANLDYSNTQILNKLDIPHGYPIKNHNDIGFEHLEPNDDFTQFLILSKLLRNDEAS
jgi:hypothetical protein